MITRAIAKYLADAASPPTALTFAEGAATGNVFRGRFPAISEQSLAVIGTGGLPEMSNLPTAHPTIQVLVRGDADDQDSADTLALWVIDQLDCLDRVLLDDGGPDEVWLIGCTALQSEPIPLGFDDLTRCYELSTNFQLHVHQPTTHRPAGV